MPYIISITRRWQTDSSTISTYDISNSSIKGYILERPGPDTTTSGLKDGSWKGLTTCSGTIVISQT